MDPASAARPVAGPAAGPAGPAGPPRSRRADAWTALALLALSGGMGWEALGYPLEGSYAGVRNAWYVSPALFPLLVAGMLALLSSGLLVRALRDGGGRGFLSGGGRALAGAADLWIVALILGGYVVVLVPRVDFVVASALALLTFFGAYHAAAPGARARALLLFGLVVSLIALAALAGLRPAPRSAGLYARDALVLGALALQAVLLALSARGEPAARRRQRHALLVALATPLLLALAFRYGLRVPLPVEGLAVEAMERLRYALR